MNKEEILYNEIYERTKDFGRTHFIKEIMRLQRELEQLKEREKEHQKINGKLRVENKALRKTIEQLYKELNTSNMSEEEWLDYAINYNLEELEKRAYDY